MPPLTASDVMSKAAALMNDSAMSVYTEDIQIPYLNMALQDLRKDLQLNNSPVTNSTSLAILIEAGISEIPFHSPTGPTLPLNLIEVQQLWQSINGSDDNWIPMTKVEFLPLYLEGVQTNQWLIWTWESNAIKILPANADNYLKIQYIRNLFVDLNDPSDAIEVLNSDSYLQFRTAGHLAMYCAENSTRAGMLYGEAGNALNVMLGIDNKGKQQIYTRRRPFRASFKQRGFF